MGKISSISPSENAHLFFRLKQTSQGSSESDDTSAYLPGTHHHPVEIIESNEEVPIAVPMQKVSTHAKKQCLGVYIP